MLEGLSRFRIAREAEVTTPYRQIDADRSGFDEDNDAVLGIVQRAEVEREARSYADLLGYLVDWDSVARLDDEMLVNGIAQIAPLDVGSKQYLLERATSPIGPTCSSSSCSSSAWRRAAPTDQRCSDPGRAPARPTGLPNDPDPAALRRCGAGAGLRGGRPRISDPRRRPGHARRGSAEAGAVSAEAEYDLTGQWSGIYNYPALYPPNTFEAVIRDVGGAITGEIEQPGEFFEPPGIVQHAMIEGSREGSSVRFVKILRRPRPADAALSWRHPARRRRDRGEWTIPGNWSGRS